MLDYLLSYILLRYDATYHEDLQNIEHFSFDHLNATIEAEYILHELTTFL